MVQYKMMEERKSLRIETEWGHLEEINEKQWVVPIDRQFREEMGRMHRFNHPSGVQPAAYRMNASPFFFKLVRRLGATGGAGILLSLGHLQQLLDEGALEGGRGGLQISYRELNGHYLRSEAFVDLVRSGYIGSQGATTDHLQTLIEATLAGGRAAVAAIQRILPDPDDLAVDRK